MKTNGIIYVGVIFNELQYLAYEQAMFDYWGKNALAINS
jgi:hypothetical protein